MDDVEAPHDDHEGDRQRGFPQLAQLAARQHGLVTLQAIRELGLSRNQSNHLISTGRLVRVAPRVLRVNGTPVNWQIEGRSKTHHFTDEAFERDPVRDAHLAIAGWIIIHVTWAQLDDDPAGVVRLVEAALSRRGAAAA